VIGIQSGPPDGGPPGRRAPRTAGPQWLPWGMGEPGTGMLVVETIAKIRRGYFAQKKPIKAICREFRLSRKVVRKVIRSAATEFHYERGRQA
jgi:hypothetical protein